MIAITLDTDWAKTEVISDSLELLNDFDISATIFSTHDDGIELKTHERALHPNYLGSQDDEATLREMRDIFPDARGVRSHSLYTHGPLRANYPKYDIEYESNYIMYMEPGLRPFEMVNGTIQFPIFFMDDFWLRRGGEEISVSKLLSNPGLKVFAFHPIHIFLNTPTIEYYDDMKSEVSDPQALRFDGYGVRELFMDLLTEIESESLGVLRLDELMERTAN